MNQEKLLICTDSIFFNDSIANFWQAQNYKIRHIPLLKPQKIPIKDRDILKGISNVAITSANAIPAILEKFAKNTNVYTISKNLGEKIQSAGYRNIFFDPLGHDSLSLKNLFLKHQPQGSVIYLCGERVRTNLNFANIDLIPVQVYRMLPIESAVEDILNILKINTAACIYVSSEQAIDLLQRSNIFFQSIYFKSDHLKNYWLKSVK